MNQEARFWNKVDMTTLDGCWLWTAGLNSKGYGQFFANGKKVLPHRFAYELLVGPIPDGLTIDHLCRNRACVNPAHMEPVTDLVNTMRGNGVPAMNARKTHCLRGHLLEGENLYRRPSNPHHRRCRTCRDEANRQRKAARRAAFAQEAA